MRAVGSKGTSAELRARAELREIGFRMRYNAPYLPGRPDIALHAIEFAIFVHGCFWHGHGCKRGARVPRANRDYWLAKIARNRTRDRTNTAELRKAGWSVIKFWECESELQRRRKLRLLKSAEQAATSKATR